MVNGHIGGTGAPPHGEKPWFLNHHAHLHPALLIEKSLRLILHAPLHGNILLNQQGTEPGSQRLMAGHQGFRCRHTHHPHGPHPMPGLHNHRKGERGTYPLQVLRCQIKGDRAGNIPGHTILHQPQLVGGPLKSGIVRHRGPRVPLQLIL